MKKFESAQNYLAFLLLLLLKINGYKAVDIVPVLAGHYISDLYRIAPQPPTLAAQAQLWKHNGILDPNQVKVSICGVYNDMMGGYGIFKGGDSIERTYDSLPSHDIIFFNLRFFAIDLWQTGDYIEIRFDGHSIFSFQPSLIIPKHPWNKCGDPAWDAEFYVVGSVFHSASSLTLTITSRSASLNAFYGLLDPRIRLTKAKQSDTQHACIATNATSFVLPGACRCPSKTYYDSDGTCKNCHILCGECFGPSASQCYGCAFGKVYDINIDACINCTNNCRLCFGPGVNECKLCLNGTNLFWNNTCQATCNPPYVQNSAFCSTPCQPNNYMLWDNTCSATCTSPLVPRIEGEAKFCDSPCGLGPTNYLYWNGSCKPTCGFYAHTTNGYQFCDACPPNNFLFPNNTCLPNCSDPYKQRIIGNSVFCDYPCQGEAKYYSDKDFKCKNKCEYPYEIYDVAFCGLRLSPEIIAQITAMKTILSITGSSVSSTGTTIAFFQFSNPAAIFLESFSNMLNYMKYMKVKFPSKLEYTFSLKVESSLEYLFHAPEALAKAIPKYPLPGRFEEDEDLHSSFLINFWKPLIFLSLLAISILLFLALENILTAYKLTRIIVRSVKPILKWNFTLGFFASYFGDIILFTSFELRAMNPTTVLEVISFLLCFLINLLLFITFGKIIRTLHKKWRSVRDKAKRNSILTKVIQTELEPYKVIFNEYNHQSIFQVSFLLILTTRICLFIIVISYLIEYPLAQAIIIFVVSLAMVLYLVIIRPLKSKIDLAQYILQELALLIAKLCVLILAALDARNIEDTATRESLGEVIVGCSFALTAINILYLIIQIADCLIGLYRVLIKLYREKLNKVSQKTFEIEERDAAVNESSLSPLTIVKLEQTRFTSKDSFSKKIPLFVKYNSVLKVLGRSPINESLDQTVKEEAQESSNISKMNKFYKPFEKVKRETELSNITEGYKEQNKNDCNELTLGDSKFQYKFRMSVKVPRSYENIE